MKLLRLCFAFVLLIPAAPGLSAAERVSISGGATSSSAGSKSPPPPPNAAGNPAKRILVVISPDCDRCDDELNKMNAPGGPIEILRKRGWKIGPEPTNHIQIVDRSKPLDADISKVVSELPPSDSPVVLCVEDGSIERSFQRGCTTPLDQWTFGWLMTGNDDRPEEFVPEPIKVKTTGNYRLRGNHWSVEGNWNPTAEYVAQHLRAAHSNNIQAGWKIEDWSVEELRSLHDDIHDREEGFRGRYASSSTSSSRSSSTGGSGLRKPGSTR
jgi:hypothetical protein